MTHRVYNFSAGPAAMPEPVLQRAQAELLDYRGSGMSVLEMSHRGSVFMAILAKAEADLRTLLGIGDEPPPGIPLAVVKDGHRPARVLAAGRAPVAVPAEVVESERRVAEETTRAEGKPEAALPKIVEGRLNGFFKDATLLGQPYALDNKKSVQKVSASDGPISMPSTSRRPSPLTPTAMITATDTMRPLWRTFRYVASIQRYGQSPSSGRLRNALTFSSISSHSRLTWLLEIPVMPIALTRSSTERVETPCT